MLVIRMQRTGRKGYATYRIVVQDVRQTPKSGRIVAQLGNYNPHTKEVVLDEEKSQFYLSNGAHPSDRIISLFKKQSIKIPDWVKTPLKQKKSIKNIDKLRKNRPQEETAQEAVEQTAEAEKESQEQATNEAEIATTEEKEPTVAKPSENEVEPEPQKEQSKPVENSVPETEEKQKDK